MSMSNKSLALLLVAAIIISLGGTIVSLNKLNQVALGVERPVVTGKAVDYGEVNLTITSNASCEIEDSVEFGSDESSVANIDTDTNNPGTWNDCSGSSPQCRGLVINNTGNVRLNISFNSSVNGTGLLGGGSTVNQFRYYINETEEEQADGCAVPGAATWTVIPRATDTLVCDDLNFTDDYDEITIEFQVNITPTTPQGLKTAIINVSCQEI